MKIRVLKYLAIGASVPLAACGDCISLGYPSARIIAADAGTRAPLSLANAVITYSSNSRPPVTDSLRSPWSPSDPYRICCSTGALRLQVTVPGYLAMDTTVYIRSEGSCNIPVLSDITLLLQRTI
jgi:hypothetical protein